MENSNAAYSQRDESREKKTSSVLGYNPKDARMRESEKEELAGFLLQWWAVFARGEILCV